ncbi:MAG: alpha/beta fold hydrolase [Anaerolineaceae bacterium]|nr:alpha/beta fold hydrolase [Anaerolineaceae bacterium]
MRKIAIFLFVSLCLLLAFPAAAQDASKAKFESATCMFNVPQGQNPDCGYLTVTEDRSQPDGRMIKLAVAVFHSDNPQKNPTPLIYLEGGPGGSALEYLSLTFNDRYAELLKDQDIILFDQRGVGRSQPALDCKEVTDLTWNTLDQVLTVDEAVRLGNEAVTACANRLAGEGIHLSSYNSAENASDVNDLRIALGYDKLDLYGISYGTKLALTIMRDHPEGVRSAIIDSIFPPQVTNNDAPINFERSLNVLFKGCAADSACHTAFPDLEKVFYDTIDQLNANPVSFQVTNPTTAQKHDVKMDGDSFAATIFQALYATEILSELPKTIYDVHNGETGFLSLWTQLELTQLDVVSVGMNYAVQCTEELAFDTTSSIEAVLAKINPKLRGFARRNGIDDTQIGLCSAWNTTKPNPIENEPVKSDIPTLVVSGEYDPITPPQYGQETAATLSNSYFFEFPGAGHGVIPSSECALSIAQAFLKDPNTKPDSACIADMKEPAFNTGAPVNAEPIKLEPYTNEDAGFSGVKPSGWKEVMAGTFGRSRNGLDQTAIAYLSLPGSNVDLALPLLAGQFGLDMKNITKREANGLQWRLASGEVQGVPLNLAITESNGKMFIILVLSDAAEKDTLYEELFLPAVDAFKII